MPSTARGISFPFRIGGRGRVVMSEQTVSEQLHIKEGIKQLFSTNEGERVMRPTYGVSNLDLLFNHLDETTKNIAVFRIEEILQEWEPRIDVNNVDIRTEELGDGSEAHVVTISYRLKDSGEVDSVEIEV